MARWAPGTATCDFSILLSDMPALDADPGASGDNAGYAAFGHVVEGMDVVQKILVESGLVLQMMSGKEYDLPEGLMRFDFTGNDQELSQLLGRMMKADIPIVSFSEETGDLEDVFLHVTKGIVQ